MPRKAYALIIAILFSTPVKALEYPASCRGATATVTNIEGFDSQKAQLTAVYTMPDALAYCDYQLGGDNAANNKPSPAATVKCADAFLREKSKTSITAEANCRIGTLRISGRKEIIKMPVETDCGSGGTQMSRLFSTLCPNYSGIITQN